MPSLEDMKKEIIDIVDKNWNPWVKAAFYSDPDVEAILTSLYEEWESQGRLGTPLDYATQEQIEILYHKAQEYRGADPVEVARNIIWGRGEEERKPKKSRRLLDYLKRLGILPRI